MLDKASGHLDVVLELVWRVSQLSNGQTDNTLSLTVIRSTGGVSHRLDDIGNNSSHTLARHKTLGTEDLSQTGLVEGSLAGFVADKSVEVDLFLSDGFEEGLLTNGYGTCSGGITGDLASFGTDDGDLPVALDGHVLDLLQDDLLSRSISCGLIGSISNTNRSITATLESNLSLSRKTVLATPLSITFGQQATVDAGQHPLELGCISAFALNLREVDVEVNILGQVRLSGVGNLLDERGCKLGVDKATLGNGFGVEGSVAARSSREGNGGNTDFVGGIASSANSAGEGNLEPDVAADIGAGNGKLRGSAIPQAGAKGVDTVLHRSDRERVDPVKIRSLGIGASRAAVSGTAIVLARCLAILGVLISRAWVMLDMIDMGRKNNIVACAV
ncbi:hypothetical protein HG531_006594 [Fusarium graminearum]|nr:hypothetical protein HG531_006594 [Fusarium graminearum]